MHDDCLPSYLYCVGKTCEGHVVVQVWTPCVQTEHHMALDATKVSGGKQHAVASQAVPGEESNMINIHCWEEEEPEDMHLQCVVDILLTNYQGLTEDDDVRTKSREVSDALKAVVAANVALHSHGEKELEDDNDVHADSALEHDRNPAGIAQPMRSS